MTRMTRRSVAATAALAPALIGAGAARGDDWPCWRGPERTGVSAERGWSSAGRETPLWSASVGLGHSCLSISDGRLYTAGFDVDRDLDVIVCLDAQSGAKIWSFEYPAEILANGHGGGTLTTPAVADGRVWVTNRLGTLHCLDANDGTLRWRRDLAQTFGTEPTIYGFGGSPLVVGDLVVANVSRTVAVRKDTGEPVWQSRDHLAMYSTPAPFTLAGAPAVAAVTKEGLFLLERAGGAVLGELPWRKGNVTVNASTPVIVGARIFISSGYGHGCALVEPGPDGVRPVWESKVMRTKLSGCVLHGGALFGFDETVLKCLDLEGKERWRKRGLGMGSLMASDGRLIVLSSKGELIVVAASPEGWSEHARRPGVLPGGPCWTSPVLANGLIYCRNGQGDLVCRDHRADEPATD